MAAIVRPASTMFPAFSGAPGGYPQREWTPGRLACGVALIAGIHFALALMLAHMKTVPRLSVGIAPLFVAFIESVHPGPPSAAMPPATEIPRPRPRVEPNPAPKSKPVARPKPKSRPDPAAAPVMTAQPAPLADAEASFIADVEEIPAGGQPADTSADAHATGPGLGPATAPGGASVPTVNISAVRYLIPPVPIYPDISRRRREEGKVTLRVLIDGDGNVRDIAIAESSGFFRLDEAARTALARAKFQPYLENGRGISVRVLAPFNFYLER